MNYIPSTLLTEDFPDPTICENKVFATMSAKRKINIQVANINSDGSFTLEDRDALKYLPEWAVQELNDDNRPWAPHVDPIFDRKGKLLYYVMYYCAEHKQGGRAIGTAIAHSLDEPFSPLNDPLVWGPGFEHIDPFVLTSEIKNDDGDVVQIKKTMYWGSAHKPIKQQELTEDGLHFLPGSERKEVLAPNPHDPKAALYEAASIVETHGHIFILVSGNDCFGNDDYFVSIARWDNNKGKFIPRAEFAGFEDSIILHSDEDWSNPGHQDTIEYNGEIIMLYHAIKKGGDKKQRSLLASKLVYKNGWLEVEGGPSPSVSARPDLFVKSMLHTDHNPHGE
jgi:hypothetical protein